MRVYKDGKMRVEKEQGGIIIKTYTFCGRTLNEVSKMIQTPKSDDIYICDTCAEIAYLVILQTTLPLLN